MANASNRVIKKPSGKPMGMQMGGGEGYFALDGSVGFFRDDFASINTDEWIETAGSTVTGVAASAGWAVMDCGTSSTAIQTFTSKNQYYIPCRVMACIGVDGINANMDAIFRVRSATAGYTDGADMAEWVFIGSAGGTEHSAQTRVRSGSTAAGSIASAASTAPSGVTGVAGSAGTFYYIDLDYDSVTFLIATGGVSTTLSMSSSGIAAPPAVYTYCANPLPNNGIPYVVEFVLRSGTASVGGSTNTAGTSSASMRIDACAVYQYAPAAALQRPGPTVVYGMVHSAGSTTIGASASIQPWPYGKWS